MFAALEHLLPPSWRGSHMKRKELEALLHQLMALPAADPDSELAFSVAPATMKRLCAAVREELLKEQTLVKLELEEGGDVVMVGDLHGQFEDLQRILLECGLPEAGSQRCYLLLGDFVDRGLRSLEICAVLFTLKLLHPSKVFLVRGNHECTEITVLFGFCGECQRRSNLDVWEAVMRVFDALPLAAVVNGRVLCVHGGLSPQLERLNQIAAIPRPTDISATGASLAHDLLWSDPSPSIDDWCPSPRGVSFVFGLEAAREVMERCGIRTLVRAHMVHDSGYNVMGDNEIITVFSASNYLGSGNRGAVLVLDWELSIAVKTWRSESDEHSSEGSEPLEELP